ncbi:hypothetical protein NAT51_19595 [Flavobacterium amniphilum]|uniref:hypothetical protein n=1 Tax=Flavobacterium amniphilum TaxID=1834035 RepID=UPI00202A202E|nr:hypothetical protein [Flavobacterium amniphilum]MCL9807730.1 hypothetical protein [Flavobacterium amniphilum]
MKHFFFLLGFVLISCKSVKENRTISNQIFSYHIGVIENYVNIGYTDNTTCLDNSIVFLESITKIQCDSQDQRVILYTPSKRNLKSWKNWYKSNKSKLYWDENDRTVKVGNVSN